MSTRMKKKAPQFKFKGQVKNLYLFHRTDNFMGENPLTVSSKNLSSDLTRIRLAPEFLYKELLTVRLDLDNELIYSNYGKSRDFTAYWRPSEYNDLLDLTWEPYRGPDLLYRIKIHRAYVKLSVDKFTATVGRQQIRFGSGKLWNPLDILNPVSPTFVEGGDEQKGTDAVRLDIYPEDRTEITAVVDFKKSGNEIEHFNMQDCNYILRIKTSVKDADIAVLGGYVSRRAWPASTSRLSCSTGCCGGASWPETGEGADLLPGERRVRVHLQGRRVHPRRILLQPEGAEL